MQLDKLESFLLKTVIPSIRIAHCPRGSYFKVLGDLILISANVSESMENILPLEQSLVPVSFKQKLTYQGSFIEEFIEKEKVKLYFDWLKANNHLYANFEFDEKIMDDFEDESLNISSEFQTTSNNEPNESSHSDNLDPLEVSVEEENIEDLRKNKVDEYQPIQNDGKQDHASIFCNKYCEDINLPTVANRFADIVVDYEINKNILINEKEDFDIEDQRESEESEETFLRQVDNELDNQEYDIEENLSSLSKSHNPNVHDEVDDDIDTLIIEQENQIFLKAKQQVNRIKKKRWQKFLLHQENSDLLKTGVMMYF